MTELEYNEVLKIASLAGRVMLENGAEIYRVEQTVQYVCKAFAVERCECYAMPTGINISIVDTAGQIYTMVQRITDRQMNLHKIELMNTFSRALVHGDLTIAAAQERLESIQNRPSYAPWTIVLASAVSTGAFAVTFGGGVREFGCAFLSGCALRILLMRLNALGLNAFFNNLIGGMTAAFLGWLFLIIGWSGNQPVVTISALMLLVPGLLITNGIRDIAAGDLVSGTSRCIEAFFIAIALSAGAGMVYAFLS